MYQNEVGRVFYDSFTRRLEMTFYNRIYSQPLIEDSISPSLSTTPSTDGNLLQVTNPRGALVLTSSLMTPENPNYYAPWGLCDGNVTGDSSRKIVYYIPGAILGKCTRIALYFYQG